MVSQAKSRASRSAHLVRVVVVALAFVACAAFAVQPVFAGQASSGELLFYPCTTCHPVTMIPGTETPTKKLPNGFKGHDVVLEGHDKLGPGDAACMSCHDDPARNPGKLHAIDGTLVDITGDVSLVCYRCHSQKYEAWKAGTHGKNKPKCTAAGCHDPHTPQSVFAYALMPYEGVGFQVSVLPTRTAFMPLMQPPPPPPVTTPLWFAALAALGLVAVGGQAVRLVRGRQKR